VVFLRHHPFAFLVTLQVTTAHRTLNARDQTGPGFGNFDWPKALRLDCS
jgi:hypothetical protein